MMWWLLALFLIVGGGLLLIWEPWNEYRDYDNS